MENKIFVFLALFGVAIFIILIAVSTPTSALPPNIKAVMLAIALVFDMLAFSSRYYGYLMAPVVKQRKRDIVLSNENAYWLSTTGDSILHKEGDKFIATVYVRIPVYLSATEMNNDEKMSFTKQFSRLTTLSRDPIRYTSQMHVMDKDSYIRKLRDTIGEVESNEARLVAGEKVEEPEDRIKGKANMWHRMLDKVSGVPSFELISYASASGRGEKEFEAITAAQQRARELMSAISSVFGVTPSLVTDQEVLKLVEPEHLIPYSTVSEQITKSLREQVA